ncbi:MAG TPA: hypothetical protein VFZ52_15215 [Chryseolinea sp.]
MKKLPLLITLGVILVVGGYFLYDYLAKKNKVTPWDLVPAETILVYESGPCEKCQDEVKNSSVLNIVREAVFTSDQDSLQHLTDFVLEQVQPGTLISLHVTRNDDFDFIFYAPVKQNLELQFNDVLDKIRKVKGIGFSEREYNGVKIFELTQKKRTFSWIRIEDVWISTFTPVLIEDVIRMHNSNGTTYKERLGSVYQLPRVKNDGGNVYVSLKNFATWFSLFINESPSPLIQHFGQSALLDVKISNDNNFVLNGFCVDSITHSNYILSAFKNQVPVPFGLKQFISNRALMVVSYGVSNGANFQADLQSFNQGQRAIRDTLAQLSKSLNIDFKKMMSSLSGEVGVAWMEAKAQRTSKILVVNSTNGVDSWINTFDALSQKVSIDTVFYEKFSEYEIRELPVHRFPEKIFYPLISGFNTSYYTSAGNTLFIGEDLDELKRYLEDIDREETWGKSVAQNQYLESTLLESNVSLFVNTPRIWSILETSLRPRWKKFVKENRNLLRSLGMGAAQFSHLNDSYYTNVSWAYKSTKPSKKAAPATAEKLITNFGASLAKFAVVKSHVDKSNEVLVQDSTWNVSLVSADGKVLWKVPTNGVIADKVLQIDYFNNGKLQYFFATPGELHIVDRLGKYVNSFPVKIPEQDIEFISLVDYDHSKKYRFFVAGKSGKIWMYDKDGTNLEGWQPKDIAESLFAPPRHYRIRGKDYIIAIRDDGNVYLMNRRGELLKNFPLNLNARPAGDYYLETGSSRENTAFVLVSRDGFRIKFNLDGKVLTRETLVKNTVDAHFSLVPEKNFKSYLILRQETKQLTLFDEKLNTVVSSDFIGRPAYTQYDDFGAGKTYITITDKSQDLSFAFDGQGKLVTILPFESYAIALQAIDLDRVKVYTVFENALTAQALQASAD